MTDTDMTGGAAAAADCDEHEHTAQCGPRGLGAEAGLVLAVLALWSDPVPVPVVAALADLPSSHALRHLRHLTRCRMAEPSLGGYRATPPVGEAVEPLAITPEGWARAARWCLLALFEAANALNVAALPDDEPELVGGCPAPTLPDPAAATDWYAATYPVLTRMVRRQSADGRVETVWRMALLMLNIDVAMGPGAAWQEVADLGLAAARRSGDPAAEAMIGEYQGTLLLASGQTDDARTLQERVGAWRELAGDAHGLARSLNALGLVELRVGDLAAAEPLFRKALEAAESAGSGELASCAKLNLGAVLARTGAPSEAKDLLEEALHQLRSDARTAHEAEGLRTLAELSRRRRQLKAARAVVERALEVATRTCLPVPLASVLTELAAVQRAEGDVLASLASLREARLIYLKLGHSPLAEQVADAIVSSSQAFPWP